MDSVRVYNQGNAIYISSKAYPSGSLTATYSGDNITITVDHTSKVVVKNCRYDKIVDKDGNTWGASASAATTALNNYIGATNPDGIIKSTDKITDLTGITASDFASKPGYTVFVGSTDGSLQTSNAVLLDGNNLRVNGELTSSTNTNLKLKPGGTGNVEIGNFEFDADQTGANDGDVLTFDSTSGTIALSTPTGGSGGSSPWTTSGSDIYYTTGNVGVGTTTPAKALDVVGEANILNASNSVLISTSNDGTNTTNTVIIGNNSVNSATTGSRNNSVFIGSGVGQNATNTLNYGQNTWIGYEAGKNRGGPLSYDATLIGYQAGLAGQASVAIGKEASNTGGSSAIAVGVRSHYNNNGSANVAIGNNSLGYSATSLSTAVGNEAGSLSGGSSSVFLGHSASKSGTANYSVLVGVDSGRENDGDNNVAVGYQTISETTTGSTISNSVAVGYQALKGTTTSTAAGAVAVGYQALTALTTGTGNTAVGYQAGAALTAGTGNTYLGYLAGDAKTTNSNTAVGFEALQSGTSSYATALGHKAGELGMGSYDIAIGWYAGAGAASGGSNIKIGETAGRFHTGGNSIIIGGSSVLSGANSNIVAVGGGANAGANTVTLGRSAGNGSSDSSVFLGYQAGSSETNSNRLYIENSNSTTPLIYGEFDNDIVRVNGTLQVNDPASTGYSFPTATGTLGQVLEVNASGDLVFATPSGGGGGGLGSADQTLTADRLIDTNGYNLAIELDPTGTADTFTIHDGTHDLFQVDTGTTGTIFSVNDVSGLPQLSVNSNGMLKQAGDYPLNVTMITSTANYASADQRFFPMGTSEAPQTGLTSNSNYPAHFCAPFNGKLLRIVCQFSLTDPGSTVVGFHKATHAASFSTTPSATVTVAPSGFTSSFTSPTVFDFENESTDFNAGDVLAFSFDATNTTYYVSATFIFAVDPSNNY